MADKVGSQGQQIIEVAVGGLGVPGTPAGGVVTVQGPSNYVPVDDILASNGFAPLVIADLYATNSTDGSISRLRIGPLADASGAGFALLGDARGSLYNGATWDRSRTPAVLKPLSAVLITAETTIWTPTAGKKFRLMGYVITQGIVTGAITLKDNTAGTTILIIPPNTIGIAQISPNIGNGILSAAANNVLTATGVATETITGYVFGTEE